MLKLPPVQYDAGDRFEFTVNAVRHGDSIRRTLIFECTMAGDEETSRWLPAIPSHGLTFSELLRTMLWDQLDITMS